MTFNFFMFLVSLFSLFFFQVPAIAILLKSDVYLTYNGSDVTSFWFYALVVMLVISLLRILLFNKSFLGTIPQGRFINFFVSTVMPKLSLLASVASFTIFSGFRKLLVMKEHYLDNAVFWGNTMIHKRYDFQTRAEYFDKLVSERSLVITDIDRRQALRTSETMSDVFDSVLSLEKAFIDKQLMDSGYNGIFMTLYRWVLDPVVTPILEKCYYDERGWAFTQVVLINLAFMFVVPLLFSGGRNLNDTADRTNSFFDGLCEGIKGFAPGYHLRLDSPENAWKSGKALANIIVALSNDSRFNTEVAIDSVRMIAGLPSLRPFKKEFPGEGHVLGGDPTKPSKLLDDIDA